MRLVTKGLLLLLVPTVAQVGLLIGFCILHHETEYSYPRRAEQDIALLDGTTRYFLNDFATVLDIREYLDWQIPIEQSFDAHLDSPSLAATLAFRPSSAHIALTRPDGKRIRHSLWPKEERKSCP